MMNRFLALACHACVISVLLFLFFRNRTFIATVSENICYLGRESGLCCRVHDVAAVGVFYQRLEEPARSSRTAKPTLHIFLVVGGRENLLL